MASCSISINGTSGSVLIRYNLTTGAHTMSGLEGDTLYIDDAATEVTYATLSGDAIAESECVTITEATTSYYLFEWETIGIDNTISNGMTFYQIITSEGEFSFPNVDFTKNKAWTELALAIGNIGNEGITPKSGKQTLTGRGTAIESIVIQVVSESTPELKLVTTTSELFLYLKGVVSADSIPEGFTEFNYVASEGL